MTALDDLHELAATVDCPRKPKGCSSPAGAPCVNWNAHREPDQHPPTTKAPHAVRLRTAQAAVPQQRQLEAVPNPRVEATADWASFGDGTPLPDEPADERWW